jgi:penicillin amidase
MKASIWKLSVMILAVAVVASGQTAQSNYSGVVASADSPAGIAEDPVTTTRDAQGIWFIEGGDLYDVYEAMGYATAQDRLWQMDLLRRQGRGKLAALLGPSLLPTDVFIRTIMYSEDEFAAEFDALSDDAKTATQAYVDGVNRRIYEFLVGYDWMNMPYEYWLLGLQSVLQGPGFPVLPEPFTVADLLGWTAMFFRGFDPEALDMAQLDNGIMLQTFLAAYGNPDPNVALAMFADLRWINDPSAQTMIPSGAKTTATPQLPMVDVTSYPDLSPAARIRSRVDAYQRKMEELNIRAKGGSYAWAISGDKTASGNPILYSGPQMGFSTPSICVEGSVRGGGLEVSGMHIPGIPGIMLGRTPHHTWSAQVGHAHTVDYYLEAPQTVQLHRMETIEVFGGDPITIPVWRSSHGPIVEPIAWDPSTNPEPDLIVAWAYAHWGHEADFIEVFLDFARAESIDDMNAAAEKAGVSMHATYADRDGNIAYWMSGWDPIRAPGVDPRLPSIADGTTEWTGERRPLAHDVNTPQGYYGGWNNKASVDYNNATNNHGYYLGPAHRAHVIEEYLSTHDNLTFEEVRDLALNIATTAGVGGGGNTWSFVADAFSAAVAADPTADRQVAVDMLTAWDGHFVAGGPAEWRMGTQRADAWVLQEAWIKQVLYLVFEDEFETAGMNYNEQSQGILFNVLLRMLDGADAALPILYPWFTDVSASGKPQTLPELITLALDQVLSDMGLGPYGAERGYITYSHQVFGQMWQTPYSNRSTYAQITEYDENGPARIESMFPLGESGEVLPDAYGQADINPHFFSMIPAFDPFMPRPFPLFD